MNKSCFNVLRRAAYSLSVLLLVSCGESEWQPDQNLNLDYDLLIEELDDREAWIDASIKNNIPAYNLYLKGNADGLFEAEAKKNIQVLRELHQHHQESLSRLQNKGREIQANLEAFHLQWTRYVLEGEGVTASEQAVINQMKVLDNTPNKGVFEQYLELRKYEDAFFGFALVNKFLGPLRDKLIHDAALSLWSPAREDWNKELDDFAEVCDSHQWDEVNSTYDLAPNLSQQLLQIRKAKHERFAVEARLLIKEYRELHDELADLTAYLQIEE